MKGGIHLATFADMLVYFRKQAGLSQKELSEKTGLSRSAIGMYESGRREPDFETLETIADYFNINMDTLLGRVPSPAPAKPLPSNCLPVPRTVKKPRLGAIACGKPILAVENISEYDDVPITIHCDFTLLCKGDSMIDARIWDGDVVYIRQQPVVENGEVAAVRIGDEATLKKVYYNGRRIILRACNPLYADMEYEGEELNDVEILGKAVAFSSMI